MTRYAKIPTELFQLNRQRFFDMLPCSSIALFKSNDIMPTNADGSMGFKQQSDLFYLTGIDQEETSLILIKGAKAEDQHVHLFIKETNEQIAIWEGNKYSKTEANEISGIESIHWSKDWESMLKLYVFESEYIYLNTNEHGRNSSEVETQSDRLVRWCKQHFPLHQYRRSAVIMQNLRILKSNWEVDLIRKACGITEKAFRRILPFVKAGKWEYEIEAEILHEFMINKSRGAAYSSIIASGASACVLHYIENNQQCQDGQLILMDFGCEYANYASDLTRCVPVSGKFSNRQKQVYSAVLGILKASQQMLKVGNTFKDYNQAVVELVEKSLVDLNLISMHDLHHQSSSQPLYKKYFMHGISHYLGLDVHDVGHKNQAFTHGMVLTCEPGIYIKEEALGIRLENNILISNEGSVNLMEAIPIEIEDIEELMNKGS